MDNIQNGSATISDIRDSDLECKAAELYSPELAYHNFQHAIDTIDAAERIMRDCTIEGILIDVEVVYYALLFHDAGFLEDSKVHGCGTKEAYSAKLAAATLAAHGVEKSTIERIVNAIIATQKDGDFTTFEQKTVRAADLLSLSSSYATFLRNTANLKCEHELLSGEDLSWCEWVERVADTIRFYLSQEIKLTNFFTNGLQESMFHRAVRENLTRLVNEANNE